MMIDMRWWRKYTLVIIVGLAFFLSWVSNFYFIGNFRKMMIFLLLTGLLWLYFGIKTRLKYFVVIPCLISWASYINFNSSFNLGVLCFIGLTLIKIREHKKTISSNNTFDNKFSHYQSLGMTDSEIELFRSTMDKAQRDIKAWENNARKSAKLKAIDMRVEGLKAAKSLFQELVRNPKRLSMAGDFLNEHLDAINDLTAKYLTIDNHAIKSKEAIKTLQNSVKVIEQLSLQIVKDYKDFVADDIADMNADIDLTKAKIKKKENYEQPSTDDINSILQADIDGRGI
ncbi:MAG: 5-bromo-4-chloroindolyl phosphate hydrolysis family protein [Lactobacillales bacterium]|jgi:5-bromo-4-chloroindolyl phosphate hydrolysis protein|nr:5-bromo-4-chloroindolyl phosphate hydrolysis family protein [Lactobacillales bacterium]